MRIKPLQESGTAAESLLSADQLYTLLTTIIVAFIRYSQTDQALSYRQRSPV
jgi:hypothetical protein